MNAYKYFAYFYDDLYEGLDYTEWLDFIFPYLKPDSSVLDLACGSGTLAILLKLKKIDVEGLDLSEEILNLAKEKAKMHHLNIPFHLADMSSFQLDKTYDMITCFFDSINFLKDEKDIDALLSCVHQHLKPNGYFIFDMFSRKMLDDYKHHRLKVKTQSHTLLWKTKKENSYTLKHLIKIKEGQNLYEETYYEYYHDLTQFHSSGFQIEKICGDFEEKCDKDASRILIIMKKKL